MKKLFFIYLHLFAPDLLCCWLRVVTTTKERRRDQPETKEKRFTL